MAKIYTAGMLINKSTRLEPRFGTKCMFAVLTIFVENKFHSKVFVDLLNYGDGLEAQFFAMKRALEIAKTSNNVFINSDKSVVSWFKEGISTTRGEVEFQIGTNELLVKRKENYYEWIESKDNPAVQYNIQNFRPKEQQEYKPKSSPQNESLSLFDFYKEE